MSLLTSEELKRVFKYKKSDGTIIELDDINPVLPPQEVIKFYSGQYPELTNAKYDPPEYEGSTMVINVSTSIGTKG